MLQVFSPEVVILICYGACLSIILIFSLGQYQLLNLARRKESAEGAISAIGDLRLSELPRVTIQLPVYNERHVIERLVKTVAAISYPRELLEIQVLDDSTDDTVAIAAHLIEKLQANGINVSHVVRPERTGFKAGALAYGLAQAQGELIAIFDADFLPAPDFLYRTVPHFADPAIGCVQVRWSYVNEHQSALTRIQSFLLGLHFLLEQPARCRSGLFLNFNGTAGVLRRAAIMDAGGWSADTLTEDIDLSYRLQLSGWRIVYVDDYACPSELPADMSGLRTQQYRWMKGGAQNARRHLGNILRGGMPASVRFHAAQHLLAGSIYLVILATVLLSVVLAAYKNTAIATDYVDYGIPFFASTLALFAVFRGAQRPTPTGVLGHVRFVAAMLAFLVFTMGLCVHNGRAVLSGWLGRTSEFVRTPKFGTERWARSTYAGRIVDRSILLEFLVLAVLIAGLVIGWRRGEFAFFPVQVMAATGLLWVIALSIVHPVLAGRDAAKPGRAVEGSCQFEITKEVVE